MTRGEMRQSPGSRDSSLGRRLRTGAAGFIFIGGAIVAGGAASVVTAFAHSFGTPATTAITTGTASGANWIVGTAVMKDSASLASNVTSDRTIKFFLWAPGSTSCTGTPVFTDSVPAINGPGTVTTAVAYTGIAPQAAEVPGTYQWTAEIIAPGGAVEDTSTCGDEPVSLVQTSPAIGTTASAGGIVGTSLKDTATVTGVVNPTGKVVFKLFSSMANCSAGAPVLHTSPAESLTASAPFKATSDSFTSTGVGTYQWIATFTGDANNKSVSSACGTEPVTISQAGPSIGTTAGAGGNVPIDVSDSATVSGGVNPTGTVTFTLYPTVADCNAGTNAVAGSSSTSPLSGGTATSATVHLTAAGTYQWLARYNGDANNAAVSSTCGTEPVTTTSPSPSPSPSPSGVGGVTTPSTGGNGSLTGIAIGGFLLLGGLGVALVSSLVPRRRRSAP